MQVWTLAHASRFNCGLLCACSLALRPSQCLSVGWLFPELPGYSLAGCCRERRELAKPFLAVAVAIATLYVVVTRAVEAENARR